MPIKRKALKLKIGARGAKRKKPSVARDIAMDAFALLCDSIASPFAAHCKQLVMSGSYVDYCKVALDPSAYESAHSFQQDYAVYSYLRKYRGFPVGPEHEKQLVQKAKLDLEKVEAQNRNTNRYLKLSPCLGSVDHIIFDAKRKISEILGPFSYAKVLPHFEWGNGATATLKRAESTLDQKLLEPRLSVTPRCLAYARAYLGNELHWMRARMGPDVIGPCSLLKGEFELVDYGVFDVVDKTFVAKRPIEKQPTLNLFFQKGAGKAIRLALRKIGVNLDDQSKNQRLASLAQSDGLATIDLQNASDTVTRELVRLLLPNDWYEFLDNIRTHSVAVEKGAQPVVLERFSAMGNGFTFELESLVFYAIAHATRRHTDGAKAGIISVYGDDIIVSKSFAVETVRNLEALGFTVNVDKTFLTGRFYESCGKHYFDGVDVTPVYQKEKLHLWDNGRVDNPSLVRGANRILKLATLFGLGLYCDTRCYGVWRLIVDSMKMTDLPTGPTWLHGDGFLKDPDYRVSPDKNGVFKIREFRNVQESIWLIDAAPLLATTLRRGCVVDSPIKLAVASFGSKSDVLREIRADVSSENSVYAGRMPLVGVTRTVLTDRRCLLSRGEVPVWLW